MMYLNLATFEVIIILSYSLTVTQDVFKLVIPSLRYIFTFNLTVTQDVFKYKKFNDYLLEESSLTLI